MPSFTAQPTNLQAVGAVIEVQIAMKASDEAALRLARQPVPAPFLVNAMVDTGASFTVLQQGLAQQLGLVPSGIISVNTPSSTNLPCYQYPVRLLLPESVTLEVNALEAPLQGQHIQCLLGRDALARAVFIYIGAENLFSLSF
jgi:hypothetical protein